MSIKEREMKTKELVDWLSEVTKYYEGCEEPGRRIKEIIKRLKKYEKLENMSEKLLTYLTELSDSLRREGIAWCHQRIEEFIKNVKSGKKEEKNDIMV
jgi:hypothetical protein